jgi:DNA-binding MarR family transcriptional regulator
VSSALAGLTSRQAAVLLACYDLAHPSVRGLARTLRMSRASIARSVAVLAGCGLVHRETDPCDRRGAIATVTPEGSELIQAVYRVRPERPAAQRQPRSKGGSGTLFYRGRAYPFAIGGLGVGGIGASTISAEGEVYKLRDLSSFPGSYVQGRYGYALGNLSGGDLWMQNEAGVILHLKAKRTGLMLSLGGDAVIISMK